MDGQQQLGLEAGPGRNAAADADVALSARDIQHIERRMQVHVPAGVMLPPAVQPRNQPAGREERRGGHAQSGGRGPLRQALEGFADAIEAAAEHRQQRGAGLGQLNAPVMAVEQFQAGLRLEPPDLLADGAVGYAELVRRGGKAPAACRRLEGTQPAQGKVLAFHGAFSACRISNTKP